MSKIKHCYFYDTKTSVYFRQSASICAFSGDSSWVILSEIEQRIKAKIEAVGTPLRDWNINIYRGILTGYNEAFIIDKNKRDELIEEDPKSAEIIRPLLRGRDIKRYSYEFADLYLLFIPWHFPLHKDPSITGASQQAEEAFENQYPAVYRHLLKFKSELSNRNKSETGVRYEWYALQRWGANYWEDFFRQKIVYPDIMRMPRDKTLLREYPYFHLDNDNFFIEATNFMITGEDIDLIFLFLTSNLGFFAFSKFYTGPQFDSTGFRYKKAYLDETFVPKPNDVAASLLRNKMEHLSHEDMEDSLNDLWSDIVGLTIEERHFVNVYKENLLTSTFNEFDFLD
ncbi:hypothetical protein QT327_04675 [Olivibacter sp. 47]|uniref:hypothetical protein n=1 Tax=Olivibacter sp. 47 TaxID=3056486 RepID=UPI0025A37FEB|nr:hypothetical protein [Olivibacter sp. 47]MDM8173661.1 hypothetical protein [Olivibacter sp. 47]